MSSSQVEYSQVLSLYNRVLEVIVKSNKRFVVAANIQLEEKMMDKEEWFPLGNCQI